MRELIKEWAIHIKQNYYPGLSAAAIEGYIKNNNIIACDLAKLLHDDGTIFLDLAIVSNDNNVYHQKIMNGLKNV